jgi:hypothetical protein
MRDEIPDTFFQDLKYSIKQLRKPAPLIPNPAKPEPNFVVFYPLPQ